MHLRIAHDTIKRMGYTDATFHTDRAPKTTEPEKTEKNYIPRYRFRWLDPKKHPESRGSNILPVLLDIEVDASNDRVQLLSLTGTNTHRPGPKVNVSPPLLHRQDQRATNDSSGGIHTRVVSSSYAAALLEGILPLLSAFTSAIKLPVQLPLRTNQLDLSRSTCRELDGQPMAQLFLTNGDRFNYQHGHVAAFYAHDAYRKFPDSGRLQDFLGQINMTTNQAIKLCEDKGFLAPQEVFLRMKGAGASAPEYLAPLLDAFNSDSAQRPGYLPVSRRFSSRDPTELSSRARPFLLHELLNVPRLPLSLCQLSEEVRKSKSKAGSPSARRRCGGVRWV